MESDSDSMQIFKFLFCMTFDAAPFFQEMKMKKKNCSTKDSIDLLKWLSDAFCSVSHVALSFQIVETTNSYST